MSRHLKYWVIYYGIWQFVHLVLNLIHFLGDPATSPIRALVGGTMGEEQIRIFELSGYIDTIVAIPAAMAFVIGYMFRKSWALPVGLVSLTIAVYSAYVNIYLHGIFGTFAVNAFSAFIGYLSFLPNMILWVLVIVEISRRQ